MVNEVLIEMLVPERRLEQIMKENPWQDDNLLVGKEVSLKLVRREQYPRKHEEDTAGGKVLPPEILYFSLELAKDAVIGLAMGLLSSWIYDKLKEEKAWSVRINGITVELSKKKIAELLIKELKRKTRRRVRKQHRRRKPLRK